MTFDLVKEEAETGAIMHPSRGKTSQLLPLADSGSMDNCSSFSSSSTYSSPAGCSNSKLTLTSPITFAKMKNGYPATSTTLSASTFVLVVILVVILCDLTYYPVHSSPLPSSSAWSLPTLNYLFKDTKTRSQSNQYKRENENGVNGHGGGGGFNQHSHHPPKTNNNLQSSSSSGNGNPTLENGGENSNMEAEGSKVSSTGRLISAHDIRLTDNWGWVRRGASDPQTTTEQRRKQNIRHSKSKHKQRHHSASSTSGTSSAGSGSSSGGSRGRKKDKTENLLCPFDEIRGPDGKCRKAPRFSLYRVGRK